MLKPIEYVVAWIMVNWHSLWTAVGLPAASGVTWTLSIIGLVVVIRVLLIPLFVKQINASRGIQLIQPQLREIQEKYKGQTDPESRQKMTQETMALYQKEGTNPLASCLPLLLQMPIFFALFRVLNGDFAIGPLTQELRDQLNASTLFGSPLSDTFLGSDSSTTKVVVIAVVVLMSLATVVTQHLQMSKNMPKDALDGPFAQQQKIMLVVFPLMFAVSGLGFPIGVLLYWLTTNVWALGQQLYVIRYLPAPGSPADDSFKERQARAQVGAPAEGQAERRAEGPTEGPAEGSQA